MIQVRVIFSMIQTKVAQSCHNDFRTVRVIGVHFLQPNVNGWFGIFCLSVALKLPLSFGISFLWQFLYPLTIWSGSLLLLIWYFVPIVISCNKDSFCIFFFLKKWIYKGEATLLQLINSQFQVTFSVTKMNLNTILL